MTINQSNSKKLKEEAFACLGSNQIAKARQLYEVICNDYPKDAEAWHMLAGVNSLLGNMSDVATCCKRVVALRPKDARAHYNLGLAYQVTGKQADAASCYREAIWINPEYTEAYTNLGTALRDLGKLAEAAERFRDAIRLNDAVPEAHYNLGLCWMAQNDYVEAAACFERSLQLNPEYAEAHFELGNVYRLGKDLDAAAGCYEKAIRSNIDFYPAYLYLANTLIQLGQVNKALDYYKNAVRIDNNAFDAHFALGCALVQLEDYAAAEDAYRNALRINPRECNAHNNLGTVLEKRGNTDGALQCYQQAVRENSEFEAGFIGMGNVFSSREDYDAAIDCYQKALGINASSHDAHYGLGVTLQNQHRLSEAAQHFRQSAELQPENGDSYRGLGYVLREQGDIEGAIKMFDRALHLRRGRPVKEEPSASACTAVQFPLIESFRLTSKYKIKHDLEQFQYLLGRGLLPDSYKSTISDYASVLAELSGVSDKKPLVQLTDAQRLRIEDTYNKCVYLAPLPDRRLDHALNPDLDTEAITQNYFNNAPGLTYFDNFLTAEALNILRQFCLESTIWYGLKYNGYVGAFMDDGFSHPLLFQIAEEIRQAFPSIFLDHKLEMTWAYKYDSQHQGIGLHADFAAANLNFWLTPDEANLDPESGGLVVYKEEAPLDWGFEKFNRDVGAISDLLTEKNAKGVRVPHRQNRAVLFNSNLFHKTDEIHFREGYENRRINITMLFGDRQHA